MKLSYNCSSCKKENQIKTNATNRHEFLMEYGANEINERCKHCGNHTKKHINRLFAEMNKLNILIGFGTSIISTILLWDFGWISTFTFSIPLTIWGMEQNKISNFNRTMVK